MALTDEGTNVVMPVQPLGGYNGGYGGSNGFLGADGSWLILFLFAMMFGGWGGNGFGNGINGNGTFPWLLNANQNTNDLVQAGFNQAAIAGTLSGIQGAVASGFGDVQLGIAGVNQNICQTGNAITGAINNGFAQSEIANGARNAALTQQLYNNEIASLNRSFAEQAANTAAISGISSQLAQCCCDNRLATESLRATIVQENCADRYEASNNTRDIIQSQTAGTQAILDKLCALEIDNYKRENENLRSQLNMASLAASQGSQTAQILAGQAARASEVEQYVNPTPRPAYIVQNPSCCQQYTVSPSCCNGGFVG